MCIDVEYLSQRTRQEAVMAIEADAGPAQDAHDELTRAYLQQLILTLEAPVQ